MSKMTPEQRDRCSTIIHTHAAAAAAGNAIPVPGLGFAADTITMTTMAMPYQEYSVPVYQKT